MPQPQLIDPDYEDTSDLNDLSAPQKAKPAAQQHNEEDLLDDEVPEKYRGKSPKDLLRILQDQESTIGRQGNELGTLRKLVDQAIEINNGPGNGRSAPAVATEDEELTAEQILTDPRGSISKVVDRATKPLQEELAKRTLADRQREFMARHPTATADAQDPKFIEWVKSRPARQRLAERAFADPTNPDLGAAEDLWDLWDEHKALTAPKADSSQDQDAQAPNKRESATTSKPPALMAGGSGGKAAERTSSPKIFSKLKLERLQMERPDEYMDDAFQAELMQAYREGRVR